MPQFTRKLVGERAQGGGGETQVSRWYLGEATNGLLLVMVMVMVMGRCRGRIEARKIITFTNFGT